MTDKGKRHNHSSVVVTGDVTMDWHLTHSQMIGISHREWEEWQVWQEWTPEVKTRLFWERGGAARLADLIGKLVGKTDPSLRLCEVAAPKDWQGVAQKDAHHHSYALWSYFRPDKKEAPSSKKGKGVWRVSNFLGMEKCRQTVPGFSSHIWPALPEDNPCLVVLDDANLGFRDHNPVDWLAPLKQSDPWIILKTAYPVARGKLWDYLHKNHPRKLIIVVPVGDLRRSEVRISRQLSWERTAQDLLWELTYNTKINLLRNCAHVVVSFDSSGVFWHSSPAAGPDSAKKELFFHPKLMEGVWGRDHKGGMIGFTTCLVAGIAQQILRNLSAPDFSKGIQLGLLAMRTLYLEGYLGNHPDNLDDLKFPLDKIAGLLLKDDDKVVAKEGLPCVDVKMPASFRTKKGVWETPAEEKFWCILHDKYQKKLSQVAQEVVLNGLNSALKKVPIGIFGDFITVDRQEIESFRSIRNLMRDYYCRSTRPDQPKLKPLSIAVFGPPGSGKSFGLTQLAKSLLPGRIGEIEFNLSQFKKPEELLGAFHQVRDLGLKGKLPLVFWDEFDTKFEKQSWFWLRYFLAPMQDGTFQEGQITHPLGRAIFVFAGSTSHNMDSFARPKAPGDFKKAKGPDFVSRIKAHIDMRGPNRPEVKEGLPWEPDLFFILRRAIMLRSLIQRHWPKLFRRQGDLEVLQIDEGVLRAFLEVEEYHHGVRSMETIITTSLLHGEFSFKRSLLPPEEQLDLHVDSADFLDLVHNLDHETVEKLAAAIHETYIAYKPESPLPRRYKGLEEEQKEPNRLAARKIAILLAKAGLMMAPASPHMSRVSLQAYVERLARDEHQRWLKEKADQGWKYGHKRDNDDKIHNLLLPWHRLAKAEIKQWPARLVAAIGKQNLLTKELPPDAKEENRLLVGGYEKIVGKAGFVIIKSGPAKEEKPIIIGVTGHRFLAELEKIKAGIREAVRRIEEVFPGRPLTILSSLAEGASQLVVRQVLTRPGARLRAILPLPQDDYLLTFKTKQAKTQFAQLLVKDPEPETLQPSPKEDPFVFQGWHILKRCDLLIAVWDGQKAQGPGGTGEIMAEARGRGLPIIWIHAGNRQPGTRKPSSLGLEQGQLSCENFLGRGPWSPAQFGPQES